MSGGTQERNHSTPDVLIIGGGLAGLSAAVELTSAGHSVLLVEQKPRLGGRVYSYVHPETGDEVDNGQHLLMGCYTETFAYLKRISALDTITVQKNLSIPFRRRSSGTAHLNAAPLPAPFNVLFGVLRLNSLSLLDRMLLLRVGLDLLMKDPDSNEYLHSVTVDQWLDDLYQSERSKKYLWDIIAIGALNDSTDKISAALFAKVLKSAFFGKRSNSSLVFPKSGLSSTLVDPASEYVTAKGGTILLNTSVEKIESTDRRIETVQLSGGAVIRPGTVISAVPYFDIPKIFGNGEEIGLQHTDRFVSSPIVTLHLWFDRHFMHEEFAALLDSPLHWVFNKSKLYRKGEEGLMYLSVVISGADDMVERSKETLTAAAHTELTKYYPEAAEARIVHSVIIKEKRATFSPFVGIEKIRPPFTTRYTNVFLAGDWTDTKLPATIEGAILSGRKCAALAGDALKQHHLNGAFR